jgi:hypothetical protein
VLWFFVGVLLCSVPVFVTPDSGPCPVGSIYTPLRLLEHLFDGAGSGSRYGHVIGSMLHTRSRGGFLAVVLAGHHS